jgi:transposase
VVQQTQYVGIDLHRRRSVIVRRNEAGETLDTVRIDNHPVALAVELAKAGEHPEVILEATYGWYWAADVIQECGGNVHLAHPLGNNWGHRRVKNDQRDATDLVDLLRMGRLAEAWVAPPPQRELREPVRYRAKLVHLRSNLKAQVHAVLAKEGVAVPMSDLFGAAWQHLLDDVALASAYRTRVNSLRQLIGHVDREIEMMEKQVAPIFAGDLGFGAIQAIPGVGPVLAAVFVAEIGDASRFKSARHLCSWAGLTPTHHESGQKVRRGHITKQGSRLVRWAAVEAVSRQRSDNPIRRHHHTVGERRGNKVGQVAAARKLLILVYSACVTARSVAWTRQGQTRNGRSPLRARHISRPPILGEVGPLIEPNGLRPNHSMSQFGRKDERRPGVRVALPAWPGSGDGPHASPTRPHRGRLRSPDGLRPT